MKNGRGFNVYDCYFNRKDLQLSVGRSGKDSTSGRQFTGDFIIDHFVDSNRNLFYDPDSFSSDPTVS